MRSAAAAAVLLLLFLGWCEAQTEYYGREVGALSELHHAVRGRVFAIDSRTLYLRDFHYDGEGPAAYFYVGSSKAPGPGAGAWRLRDERGGTGPLRRYRGEGLTLSLPDNKTLRDIKWFSVWCDEFSVNFGSVVFPGALEPPRPVRLAALRGVHGVASDPLVVVDAQTLLLPNFSYDGEAPDAKFWVGRGDKPSPQGIRIPDENGKESPLRRYDHKTIVLTLPGELTVFDIGHFAVWCEAFTVNFGHVPLPRAQLANVPPSLRMLGVSPQSRNKELVKQEPKGTSSGAQHKRPRPHRPQARVDATTYRPHLRPGAGPLAAAALLDPPADHSSLHRRADSYSPPADQLIPQDDRQKPSLIYQQQKDDYQPQKDDYQQKKDDYQQQIAPQDQQPKDDQQQQILNQNNQQQINNQDDKVLQNYPTQPEQYYQDQQRESYQQQNYHPQQTVHQQHSQQIIQPQQYQEQNENFQQQRSQELYYHDPTNYDNQQIYYQRPQQFLNEQLLHQQRAYEEQLRDQQYTQQQYRLVPYYTPRAGRY